MRNLGLKSAVPAALLSFAWPGLGQIYNRGFVKGIAAAIVHIFLVVTWYSLLIRLELELLLRGESPFPILPPGTPPVPLELVLPLFLALIVVIFHWIYWIHDAHSDAKRRIAQEQSKLKYMGL